MVGAEIYFFFNDTATTEIYTLSLHDALPISDGARCGAGTCRPSRSCPRPARCCVPGSMASVSRGDRKSTTSELQSRQYLVCRLLLVKKKNLSDSSELQCGKCD